ncbi:MAG: hypothetical protein NZ551_00770 [Microscillaceae bacterium]|nr:hypothetical protein [Microscillaceae bacterium]MDW8459721.1 hypothetical protein [Cytophagales bacterium]
MRIFRRGIILIVSLTACQTNIDLRQTLAGTDRLEIRILPNQAIHLSDRQWIEFYVYEIPLQDTSITPQTFQPSIELIFLKNQDLQPLAQMQVDSKSLITKIVQGKHTFFRKISKKNLYFLQLIAKYPKIVEILE